MAEREPGLFAGIRDEIGSIGADLKQIARLRWQLARLEFETALDLIKGLAVRMVVVGVAMLVSLSVLIVAAVAALDGLLGIPFWGWLLATGLALLIGSTAAGYLVWRWFWRRFAGMEQSLEELHEDLVWLKQYSGSEAPAGNDRESHDSNEPLTKQS